MAKVASNKALEEEVKVLKKHFGAVVTTVKDLKCIVDDLKRKIANQENDEIKKLLAKQKVMDQVINANTEAIKRIDR